MTLRNSWPGPTGVTTTTDARINLAGILEGTTSGVARAGVFPTSLAAIVTARSDMNVDVGVFHAALVQFGGPVLIANDGVMQLPSALVSPASGTNYYVVYVKQNEATSPGTDSNNLPVLGAALSATSFAVARGTLPTGALELATVQVPSGVSATNAGGVTITQTAPYTVAEGGVLPLRNQTDQAAWTPADGSEAYRLDTNAKMKRIGGTWYQAAYTATARLAAGGTGLTSSTMTQVATLTLPADAPPGTYLVMFTVTTSAGAVAAHYQQVTWAGTEITNSVADYMNNVAAGGDVSKSDTVTKTAHPGGAATVNLSVQVNGASASCRFARLTVLYVGAI